MSSNYDMASTFVNIKDFRAALGDGTIPGAFNDARTVWTFPTVESVSSRGARLFWTVSVSARSNGGEVPITDAMLEPGAPLELTDSAVGVVDTESYQISAKGVRGAPRAGGKPTVITEGKNLGKKNQTNPVTQALREALSRYNAQKKRASKSARALETREKEGEPPGKKVETQPPGKKGETLSPEKKGAPEKPPPPMLVKKIGSTKGATLDQAKFDRGITVQRKYNGVRTVARALGKGINLYSRTGATYPGFDHIRDELACILAAPPPVPDSLMQTDDGLTRDGDNLTPPQLVALRKLYEDSRPYLDGEIYLHGKPLQWISGQARKEGDEKSLEYHVFDVFFPHAKAAGHDMPSAQRQEYLDLFFKTAKDRGHECTLTHVKRAENFRAKTLKEVDGLAARFLKEGYEGAIARKDWAGYRYSFNNYHSDNVVKIKPLLDSEFAVVGYTQGKKGKDVGAVIWVCEVDPGHVVNPNDVQFNVVPKDMSYEDRYKIYKCLGETVDNTPAAVAKGAPKKTTRFERDFKGKPLTVEYPERSSKTGKPVQAKALTFRTYEEGSLENDPLRRLYAECGDKK